MKTIYNLLYIWLTDFVTRASVHANTICGMILSCHQNESSCKLFSMFFSTSGFHPLKVSVVDYVKLLKMEATLVPLKLLKLKATLVPF